jgi:hypothetical protein
MITEFFNDEADPKYPIKAYHFLVPIKIGDSVTVGDHFCVVDFIRWDLDTNTMKVYLKWE